MTQNSAGQGDEPTADDRQWQRPSSFEVPEAGAPDSGTPTEPERGPAEPAAAEDPAEATRPLPASGSTEPVTAPGSESSASPEWQSLGGQANPASAWSAPGGERPVSGGAPWQTPGGQPVSGPPTPGMPGGQANPAASPGWQAPGGQPVSGAPAWQPTSGTPGGQPVSGAPAWQPVSGTPGWQPVSGQPGGQPVSGQPGWQPVSATPGWHSPSQQQQAGAAGWPPAPPGWRPAGPMPPAWAQGPSQGQGQWQAGPKPVAYPSPVRFEGVPGEPFALAILPTPRVVSGVSVGALVAGIGSILVSGAVWCFGFAGSSEGWGALVGGAFFVLAALLGLAGIGLGVGGLRNVRRDITRVATGKGYAITGIACGGFGVLSAILGLVTAIILTRSA